MSDTGGLVRDDHGRSGDDDSHDHCHGRGGSASSRTLALVSGINLAGFALELAGGLLFGSVALISNLPGMVYRCRNEPAWSMEIVRGECEPLCGYPAEALERGDVVWGEDILHPDDREDTWAAVQSALEAGRPFEVTYRIRSKDGEIRWMWERGRLVSSGHSGDTVLEGFIMDVSERRARERERERTVEFMQRLYAIATDRSLDTTATITRLLEMGPQTLGLPRGYLTRIEVDDADPEAGTQRVIEASGDHELLQPGDVAPLAQSYCRKTIEADAVVAIHDALEAGWGGDPAYELFNLGCYIGTAISVDDEFYGTVFFAAEAPRDEPFTDADRTFVRLMSQLVSDELEREQGR